jgi:hypothetical protein
LPTSFVLSSRSETDNMDSRFRGNARTRLIRECAKLDPVEERALAAEGLGAEGIEWPAY